LLFLSLCLESPRGNGGPEKVAHFRLPPAMRSECFLCLAYTGIFYRATLQSRKHQTSNRNWTSIELHFRLS